MNRHTTAVKGKRVRVKLKDGRVFIDKLKETRHRYFEFEENGKIPYRSIVSFAIAKPRTV